eukprot:4283678-Prymnesium_polylepis.2
MRWRAEPTPFACLLMSENKQTNRPWGTSDAAARVAHVCGGGDVVGEVSCGRARPTRMAHCAGPWDRKAAQAQAAERQAS